MLLAAVGKIVIVYPLNDRRLGRPSAEKQLRDRLVGLRGGVRELATPTSAIVWTHVVLGEAGNVAGYGLEPVQAVLSRGELDHPTAHSVHGYDLECIFPERRDEEERPEGL